MKALVTGAAGFIGSHIAEALVTQGAHVVGVDCFTDYYPREVKERNLTTFRNAPNFQFIEGALQTLDAGPLLDGVTHVFHMAAQAGVRKSWGDRLRDLHRRTTSMPPSGCSKRRRASRFIDSCMPRARRSMAMRRRSRCARMRTCSRSRPTASRSWPPSTCATCILRTIRCRPCPCALFTVYGPRQRPDMAFNRFIRAGLAGLPITLYGDGEQTRDFTFVNDIVAASLAAGDRGTPGAVYNIGGGSRVSVNQVLQIIGRLVGRPLNIRREETQKGDMRDTFADTSRARADSGVRARVDARGGPGSRMRLASPGWSRLIGQRTRHGKDSTVVV